MKVNREWKSKGTDRPGRNRTMAAPRRSDIMPASSSSPSHPSGGDEGKSKGANRTRRDRTNAKDAAAIFASSSPLFCSVCCPHRLHHRQPITTSPACVIAQGEGRATTLSTSGRCHRHHIAAPIRLHQLVRVGQRASQGGRSHPAHPADPLHPAGVPRHIGGHPEGRGGCSVDISGGRTPFREG